VSPGQPLMLKVTEVPCHVEAALLMDIVRELAPVPNGTRALFAANSVLAFFNEV
jgi:hypothetical protein